MVTSFKNSCNIYQCMSYFSIRVVEYLQKMVRFALRKTVDMFNMVAHFRPMSVVTNPPKRVIYHLQKQTSNCRHGVRSADKERWDDGGLPGDRICSNYRMHGGQILTYVFRRAAGLGE